MQHVLQVSRKIDYGLRAMIYLASVDAESVVPFREIAKAMEIPQDFLAKILKTLVNAGLVHSVRGAHGGYGLAHPPQEILFLDVIEAVEGPVRLNLCLSDSGKETCRLSSACTMYSVWREGQDRMLDVYRNTHLDSLAMKQQPDGSALRTLRTPESPPAA